MNKLREDVKIYTWASKQGDKVKITLHRFMWPWEKLGPPTPIYKSGGYLW